MIVEGEAVAPVDAELAELRRRVAELEAQVAEREQMVESLLDRESYFRRLDAEQQRLIAVIEGSSDFVGLGSLDGRLIYLNEAGRALVGLEGDAAADLSIEDFLLPDDLPQLRLRVMPQIERRGHWEGETRLRHFGGGAPIPVHMKLFMVKDRNSGQPIGLATVTRDISEQKQAAEEHERLRDEIIRAQEAALAELSTPLLAISERIVVMPLIGSIDTRRARQVIDVLLNGVAARRASVAILDITGVSVVDTQVANALVQAAQAVQLLGARVILTGIRPEIAQTLVGLGVNLSEIATHSTLQSGIAQASR